MGLQEGSVGVHRPSVMERPFSLGYRPALDGIRAVAVMLVVLDHVFKWPRGGFLGVDMFFVLSGFLITSLLVQEWMQRTDISLGRFYRRRALRLLPALSGMLLVYLLIVTVRVSTGAHTGLANEADNFWGALLGPLYLENILIALHSPLRGELIPLWSLATEEQFYLLFPPLLLLALNRRLTPDGILKIVGGLIAAVFVWRFTWSVLGASFAHLYIGPDMRFDSILTGCLVAFALIVMAPRRLDAARSLAVGAVVAGIVVVWAVLFVARTSTLAFYARGGFTLFAVCCGVLILFIVQAPESPLANVLALRPMVFLGRLSYSIYLWHVIVLVIAASVFSSVGHPSGAALVIVHAVEVLLSIAAGYLSYRFIEIPFLRRKRKYESKAEGQAVPEVLSP